jgi:murein L,D-transpeptidase YafK
MGSITAHTRLTRRALLAGALRAGALALAAALPARAQDESVPRAPRARFPVDLVVIEKGPRLMHLFHRDRVVRTYRVALGANPVGAKRQQGDGRTPEGLYRIDFKNPDSRFNLALRIDYPNERDRARAAARGVPPGGQIDIHGQPWEATEHAFFRMKFAREDWTDGCIAVTNREMSEIYDSVPEGTPVLIRP